MNFSELLAWLAPIALSLVVVFAVAAAYRPARAKETNEAWQRLDTAQKAENANLTRQVGQCKVEIEQLKAEVERQKQVQDTLRYVLKPMGIDISVEGDFVRVYEAAGAKALTVTPIKKRAKHNPVTEVEPDKRTEEEQT